MSSEDTPSLSLEQWAKALAHQQHFGRGKEAEVLRRLGIDAQSFLQSSMAWSSALARAAAARDRSLTDAFANILRETKERLARERPSLDSLAAASDAPWNVDATAFAVPALSDDDVLPFRDAPSPEFLAGLGQGVSPPSPDIGETMAVACLSDEPNAVFPFAASQTSRLGPTKLTLEQYASFCAELAAFPQGVEATRARYGLGSAEEHLREERAWSERLAQDAALATKWQKLMDHFRTWLLRNGRT